MRIYNTLSRKKEKLKPLKSNEIKIYACGPTVYNYIHIGNARPMCVFDVLRRYLEYKNYKVYFMQNFTDIDDKIINKSIQEGVDYLTISEKFINEYKIDANGLNILPPTYEPRATEHIEHIIKIISELVNKNMAYEKNGNVFFSVKKYKDYGCLSKMPMEELELGARIEVNSQKKDALDFALWKSAKDNEPYWQSPWGKGRPGWHIECTAMINKIFGSTIDIHCGGKDLIFPHHENEIAQSVCYTGEKYVNYWMHNGYINVDNKKMSKSAGNFFTVRDIAQKFGYDAIRFMMLQVHYRNPINYSYDVIQQCVSSLERIKNCKSNLQLYLEKAKNSNQNNNQALSSEDKERLLSFKNDFINYMDDDLNTADAISVIFELITEINTNIINKTEINNQYLFFASEIFDELTNILGILYNHDNQKTSEIPDEIKKLIQQREQARKQKDYKQADEIRNKILSKGFELKDTSDGPVVTHIKN